MKPILQSSLPYDVHNARALPGILPFEMSDWLTIDDAFSAQMAERTRLLTQHRSDVLAMDECARAAAVELLDMVLSLTYGGVQEQVVRPDGVLVDIDRSDPLGTLGHLIQEDLCILQKIGDEHVLTGAVLCFPASWTLAEKFMRPLLGIHDQVAEYDGGIAKRVQRLFDGVREGRPMWRFNALWYEDANLHQPRSIHDKRTQMDETEGQFLRSEHQCILRLPQSGAVVFSIHTYVLARAVHEAENE